jgi:type II secretory pathway pseudopilin PulG
MTGRSANEGYTLVETIVAMALFVGVLTPLVGLVGQLVLDNEASSKLQALNLAQDALASVQLDRIRQGEFQTTNGGYVVAIRVKTDGRLSRALVRVSRAERPMRLAVVIERIWLNDESEQNE